MWKEVADTEQNMLPHCDFEFLLVLRVKVLYAFFSGFPQFSRLIGPSQAEIETMLVRGNEIVDLKEVE